MAVMQARQTSVRRRARILFIPGFVTDTYSEIERSYVELCGNSDSEIDYLWLVPEISRKHNRFARPESRAALSEPVWMPHLRSHGVSCIVGNISKYNPFTNWLLFRRVFRDHEIDAVYVHFGMERYWAAFFGRIWGKAIIWNEHWHSLGRRFAFLKRPFYLLFVDHFIAVSKFISGTLPRRSLVHTVPNAIMLDRREQQTAEEKNELRSSLGVASDARVVVMVAAFRSEKQHMIAFDVCERVLAVRNNVAFLFLGEGRLRPPFLAMAKEKNLDRHILAPGHVDNVDDYYSIADVSMLTSHYEPFGYVVLEAMKYALPVVAFATGGPGEVIRNGETGFLTNDGDVAGFTEKLIELLDNGELRREVGKRAYESVRCEYNREVWIQTLNRILFSIVIGSDMKSADSR